MCWQKVDLVRDATMNTFNNNMTAMKKSDPELHKRLLDYGKYKNTTVQKTPSGFITMSYNYNGNTGHFCSTDNPNNEAITFWNDKGQSERCVGIMVFLGLGLGYHLFEFIKKPRMAWANILVIEKDIECLLRVLRCGDISKALSSNRIKFIVGVPEDDLSNSLTKYFMSQNTIIFSKAIEPIFFKPVFNPHKMYYRITMKLIKFAILNVLMVYGNDPRDSMIGLVNMIRNLDRITENPGVNQLYGKFKGKPAIIVSSGPSLTESLDLLKEANKKVFVICVDGSLKTLLNHGIYPDMVCTQERGPSHKRLFDVDSEYPYLPNTWMVACPVQDPVCYDVYPGPQLVVYRNLAHFKWLGIDKGIETSGASVSHLAFLVAKSMGCDPIVLLGQDLAYGKKGETHESGAGEVAESFQRVYAKGPSMTVEGNSGKGVETTPKWHQFKSTFEMYMSEYSGRCINAIGDKGAKIQGTEIMTFKQVLDDILINDFDTTQAIRNNIKIPTKQEAKVQIEKVIDKAHLALKEFDSDISECEAFLKRVNHFSKRARENFHEIGSEALEMIKRCQWKRQELFKDGRAVNMLAMHVIQSYIINLEMQGVETAQRCDNMTLSRIRMVELYGESFRIVADMIRCVKKTLKEEIRNWRDGKDGCERYNI